MSPLLIVAYLLATGDSSGRGGGRGRTARSPKSGRGGVRKGRGGGGGSGSGGAASGTSGRGAAGQGRNRYTRDGIKKRPSSDNDDESRREELRPLPPVTVPNGPRPSYYTCRHNYESTLIDEIQRYATIAGGEVMASSPYPGLVRVEGSDDLLPELYDPVYALQCIPQSVVVTAESSRELRGKSWLLC